MTKRKFFGEDPHKFRNLNEEVYQTAFKIRKLERKLIRLLYEMDRDHWYRWFGYRSFRTYTLRVTRMSQTQAQRLVTRVRNFDPNEKYLEPEEIGQRMYRAQLRRKAKEEKLWLEEMDRREREYEARECPFSLDSTSV
jgi:hypothetical protein